MAVNLPWHLWPTQRQCPWGQSWTRRHNPPPECQGHSHAAVHRSLLLSPKTSPSPKIKMYLLTIKTRGQRSYTFDTGLIYRLFQLKVNIRKHLDSVQMEGGNVGNIHKLNHGCNIAKTVTDLHIKYKYSVFFGLNINSV